MPNTFEAPFAQVKRTGSSSAVASAPVILTAAKTTYSDAANAVLLAVAGPQGALVRRITAMPRATVTATQLQLYRSTDAGVTLTLCDSVLMAATTIAATTAIPKTDFGIDFAAPLSLAAGERLYVAAAVALAAGIVVTAEFEDF